MKLSKKFIRSYFLCAKNRTKDLFLLPITKILHAFALPLILSAMGPSMHEEKPTSVSLEFEEILEDLKLIDERKETLFQTLFVDKKPLWRKHRFDLMLTTLNKSLGTNFDDYAQLVHHVRKSPADQPGQTLRGSGDLHAWSDSSLYLLRRKGRIELHAEHRCFPSPGPVSIALATEPLPHLQIVAEAFDEAPPVDPLVNRILGTLAAGPKTRTALRDQLGVRNERLGEVLSDLVASGQIVRRGGLLAVPVPTP